MSPNKEIPNGLAVFIWSALNLEFGGLFPEGSNTPDSFEWRKGKPGASTTYNFAPEKFLLPQTGKNMLITFSNMLQPRQPKKKVNTVIIYPEKIAKAVEDTHRKAIQELKDSHATVNQANNLGLTLDDLPKK